MAENLKTLKRGRQHILLDGSTRPLWNEPSTGYAFLTGVEANDGTALIFYVDASGDLIKKTGNHLLTPSGLGTTGSSSLDQTHAIENPVVYRTSDYSGLLMWFAYDSAGGSGYSIYYAFSSDNGDNWSTPVEVVALGSGGSWNDTAMRPVGAHHDVTNEVLHLFALGSTDGTNWGLGHWTVDTSSGTLTTVLGLSGNYTADTDNPVKATTPSPYGALLYKEGRYFFYGGDDATPTNIYLFQTHDPSDWSGYSLERSKIVLGASDAGHDSAEIRPSGVVLWRGHIYLFYLGVVSGPTYRPMVAVGRVPDKIYKVGGVHNLDSATDSTKYTLTDTEAEVYWSTGDLAYTEPMMAAHVLDRGNPGFVLETPHEDFEGTFTYRAQFVGTAGVAAAGESKRRKLISFMMLADPSLNESKAGNFMEQDNPPLVNTLYRVLDESGNDDNFVLFPNTRYNLGYNDDAEGTLINATFMCYGSDRPIVGRY